jgi:ABC-2 type transport system ATP-binding protein
VRTFAAFDLLNNPGIRSGAARHGRVYPPAGHVLDETERGAMSVTPGSGVLMAEGLSKSYGSGTVLRDLTFTLPRGHVMGFLGPNGAGKTTSIRILTTIMQPTSGRFEIDGQDFKHPSKIRPLIGVLPETLGLPNQISGMEYLSYFAQLYGWKRAAGKERARELLDLVGLRTRGARLIRTYSHGMRQRLGIARALVNDPVVLFLDEPVLGLDPRGQQDLLALLRDIAANQGASIILSSHALSDVEGICDDVVILTAGRVVASGPLSEVLANARHDGAQSAALRVRVPGAFIDPATTTLRALDAVSDVSAIVDGDLRVTIESAGGLLPSDEVANELLVHLIRADIPVLGFEIEGSRLSDVFLELTEKAAP